MSVTESEIIGGFSMSQPAKNPLPISVTLCGMTTGFLHGVKTW